MTGEVKLELRLSRTNAGAGTPMVYWKPDGGRFKFRYRRRPPPRMPRPPGSPQPVLPRRERGRPADARRRRSSNTLKLVKGGIYDMKIKVEPEGTKLVNQQLHLSYRSDDSKPLKNELLQLGSSGTFAKNTFQTKWHCKADSSSKEGRVHIFLNLGIEDFGQLELPMVAKVYDPEKGNFRAGKPLNAVTVAFGLGEDGHKVNVLQQNFV